MSKPWEYDESRQLAVDFADPEEARLYETKHPSHPEEAREALERIGVGEGTVLVDMGCATGWFTVEAAKLGAIAHGVDSSAAMVEAARRKAKEMGVEATFHQAGFFSYEHPGPPPDVVVARFVLHHMPDFWKSAAFIRVARLLRPGGLLHYRDVTYSFAQQDYEAAIDKWLVSAANRCGYSETEMLGQIRDEFTTYAWIIEGMLERAGFEIVHSEATPDGMLAEYLGRLR
jgi:predicted TPR repeat methyltransferase